MELVLASTSPWRRALLEQAGVPCRGEAPEVDERSVLVTDPTELACELAVRKARSVSHRFPDALVLGADQIVHVGERIFHKPVDPAEHLGALRFLRARRHRLVTGVALLGRGLRVVFHEETWLTFRADLADEELRAYVASGEGAGCAGGYEIERRGSQLVERVEGDWFNVVGLPVLRVITELRRLGWRPSFQEAAP
jgi:septum formation protein